MTGQEIDKSKVDLYLQGLFDSGSRYELTDLDSACLNDSLSNYLVGKILTKKFRKRRVSPETEADIRRKVEMSVMERLPIHFTIPFGGYKHFWNPSHPRPDWAELFNLAYLSAYAAPMAMVHEPGVIFEYISEDLIVPYMNNYPHGSFEEYRDGFQKLIDFVNSFTPDNIRFDYWRVGDRCDGKKLVNDVLEQVPAKRDTFEKLSPIGKERELHRSYRAIMLQGEEDWSRLTELEKQEKVIQSRLMEMTYYETEGRDEYLGDYFIRDNHIYLLYSFGFTPDNVDGLLTIGSTKSSIVDPWVGRGVIEYRKGKFIPRIVSKEQYETMKGRLTVVDLKRDANPLGINNIEIM